MEWWIDRARQDIVELPPYKPAQFDKNAIRLNANENPWRLTIDRTDRGLHHYPEPYPSEVAQLLAQLYGCTAQELVVTRGADEAIDLLIRAYIRWQQDEIIICPPTFGMYLYAGRVQGAYINEVPLTPESFELDIDRLGSAISDRTKLIFLCSPNNPTGNRLSWESIRSVAQLAEGRALLVVDEAYVEFADESSLIAELRNYPGLVLLRTLSKAYSLAGARCGALIAHPKIVEICHRVLPPYSMALGSIEAVLTLARAEVLATVNERIQRIKTERKRMESILVNTRGITQVYQSQANFILVRCKDQSDVIARAALAGLLIRSFDHMSATRQCVRISIGTPEHNARLIEALNE